MIDKLYKRIVRFFVETHIARIDFSSEEEAEEFLTGCILINLRKGS